MDKFAFVLLGLLLGVATVSTATEGADTLRAAALKDQADAFYASAQYDSASLYYKEAADLWSSRSPLHYVSSVISAANALVRLGHYSPAYELLRTAEPAAATLPPRHASVNGTFLLMIGYCLQNREQLDDAERYALRALEVLTSAEDVPQDRIASAHYTLGGIRKSKGKYPEAVASFTAAATIQRTLPDSFSFALAGTLILLGAVHDDMNAFDAALDYYGQAVAIHRRLGKDATTQAATCYLHMMSTYTNMADYRSAAEMGQKVLDIYYALGLQYHANMASALGKFAEVYANTGDLEKAEEYFLRALDIFTEYHPHKRSAIGNMNQRLGDLYMRMGNISKAVDHAERGVRLYEDALGASHPQTGFMYELMAGVYQAAGRMNEAIGMYNRSIAARSAVPNAASRFDIAMAHSSIAAVYLSAGKLDSALVHMNVARAYDSLSSGHHILQRSVLFQRFGDYYDRKKDYNRSLVMYQRSIVVLTGDTMIVAPERVLFSSGTPYPSEVSGLLASKARVLERRFKAKGNIQDLVAALKHFTSAMDLSEEARKRFTTEGSKLHTASASLALYRNACRIALELNRRTGDPNYTSEAFLIADRSKGNVLLERLFENDARRFAGVPESLLTYERQLLSELSRQERRISEVESTQDSAARDQAAELRSRYFRTKLEHQHFVRMLEQQFPRYHALKYADSEQSMERIQQQLTDSAALVEFMLDGDRIYVFTVTRTDVHVTTLKDVAVLRSMVQRYVQALKTYDASSYTSTGADLYRAVLQPLEPSIAGVSGIKFVPDGFLHYLPFETLPLKRYDHRSVPFHAMRYLIHRFDVTYAYSGAVAAKMQETGGAPSVLPHSFVGFAPVFRDTVRNADFLAQRDAVVRSGLTDARSITVDGRTFNELRYSEMEVDAIGKSLRDRSVLTQQYLFADATEENFKQAAPQFDIVHVATHGFINEQNPKYSAIVFSQPAVPGREDGILYVNETFTLDLKARLVVLSSCESGIGRLVDGEGMIALSRGLFYAGARNIMLSLWKVSDQQTYGLMEPFYRHIAAGEMFPSALRKAKLSMIARPSSAFPAKWGGFILMGQ